MSVLFGSIFGISAGQARTTVEISVTVAAGVLLLARPLLFASLDPDVAAARGLPVRAIGLLFLCLVGVTTAQATQVVGALLILGLLAAPAGAANRLTAVPLVGLGLSAAIAAASLWVGLAAALAFPVLPPSFAVVAAATLAYLGAHVVGMAIRPTGDYCPAGSGRVG